MLLHISKILIVAGVYMPKNEDDYLLQDFVRTSVEQRVNDMWHTAEAFAQRIREQVHSTDYELTFVTPGDKFDPSVMRAQGAQPPSPAHNGEEKKENKAEDNVWRVLCTTDLGLQKVMTFIEESQVRIFPSCIQRS